jgi:hypothetical protein
VPHEKAAAGLRQRRLLCSEVTPWTRAEEIVHLSS